MSVTLINHVMGDKSQCRCCTEYGRVNKYKGWCCICVEKNGFINVDKRSRKSNCWCLDQKPYGELPVETDFHTVARYLTETYGVNVTLIPNEDTFSVYVENPRFKFPVRIVFSMDGDKDTYSFEQAKQILKQHEVD